MRIVGKIIGFVLPLAILGAAAAAVTYLYNSAPEVQRTSEARRLPLVEAIPLERRDFDRVVEGTGTVSPAREVEIVPEVSGRITKVHPLLEPGGVIPQGEILVEIDPEEYELALARARGALAEAEAALEVEQGRQLVARREWELYGKELPNAELGQALALREPQLRQAEARIESEESVVKEAELNLKRTKIAAPFAALVLSEDVEVGQYVSPGTAIASFAGSETFWINVSFHAQRLEPVLEAMRAGQRDARVFREVDDARGAPIPGRVVRDLGRVSADGHMAQLLVEIFDPLGLDPERPPHPTLPLNTFVTVALSAGTIEDAIVVPARALRENGEVWVADAENKLQIRTVDVLWKQEDEIAVSDAFEPGDRIVISPVGDLLPRMEVRLPKEDTAATEGDTEEEAS